MPDIIAVAGKSLHIKCPVAGYPIENVIWEKGERSTVCRAVCMAAGYYRYGQYGNFSSPRMKGFVKA